LDIFTLAFLVPLFPALGFVLLGLGGDRLGKLHGWLAVGFEGAALVSGLVIAVAEMTATNGIYHDTSFVWLYLPNGTNFVMGTLVSPLGALMLLVVNIVGFLVVLYSNEYMAHEEGLPRYYAELMLFLTAMNALVLADNYLEFILFWELVGLCSYLLIGFFYKKPEAASAAKKAFLVTRIGDVMFFLGVFIFFTSLATKLPSGSPFGGYPGTVCQTGQGGPGFSWSCSGFTFTVPNSNTSAPFLAPGAIGNSWLATLGGIMIVGGAVGKSAQFPLHTWLPDAMEGPTTVSALIHAATMVAAGIYLLAITSIFLGFTETAASVVLAIGAFTSLFAGTMGLVAPDIKRVIAYSTISQLGYMAMAVGASAILVDLAGAGNQSGVAMFHLFNHAFFKALLFLCAGAVIHAVGTQDIFKMGGLRKLMPITSMAMLVGALALSGIPPFAGFFSKDEVLEVTLAAAQQPGEAWIYLFLALAMAGIFLTALYVFRLWFLVFSGEKPRDLPSTSVGGAPLPSGHGDVSAVGTKADAHGANPHATGPRDPTWIMSVPLLVLAALACVSGFLPLLPGVGSLFPGLDWSAFGLVHTSSGFSFVFSDDVVLGLVSLALAALGILTAWRVWGNGHVYALPQKGPTRGLHTVLRRKYYMDEAYDAFAEKGILTLARAMDWVDRYVIDGAVRGIEETFSQLSKAGRRLQTGVVSSYATWIVVGLLLILGFFLYLVPWIVSMSGGG
jgi:NADH-quinone oxidoreductase subunit L